MKIKICIIITAIIFFTASELTAIEDKIFTSSGQILPDEEWENVYIYNDDTIVDMLGGLVDGIATYDASTLNVTGGYVSTLDAREFSTVNVSAGYVYTLWAWDSGTATLSETGSVSHLSASGNFGTANMCGGSAGWVDALDSGTVNLYAGIVSDYLSAPDGTINVFGYDLSKTATGGSYGYGFITGYWDNDTSFVIDLLSPETYSHINLILVISAEIEIKPNTLNLSSKGKWLTCHIWLPEDYNVADVNSASVFLEDELAPDWIWFNKNQNVVMAKFARSELEEILEPGEVELTVAGYLMDGSYFVGTDNIKVIDKGRKL